MPDFAYPGVAGVALRDSTLRDGLQLTGGLLPTEAKVALARALWAVGIPEVEVGAMARPDLVPPMANTVEVLQALTDEERERAWVWTATPSGVRRALETGARNLEYCFSASDAHNRANVGRSTEESLAAMPEAVAAALEVGARIQLTLATSFTDPFTGPVEPDAVIAIVSDPRAEGAQSVAVCDTLGQAVPAQVSSLVRRVVEETPPRRVYFHGHDTWGQGVANALAAVDAGALALDACLAGLGGCPFAPGASGNTSTEDLLFALRPEWFEPAVLWRLVELSEQLTDALGEPDRSKAVQGARSTSEAFEWVIPSSGTVA